MDGFVRQEKGKLLATVLVAGFFAYFWVNGPLAQELLSLDIAEEFTKFSIPKLVGEHHPEETQTYGTIEDAETHGFGHGLMMKERNKGETTGLISGGESDLKFDMNAHRERLLSHAHKLFAGAKFEFASEYELPYLIIEQEGSRFVYLESAEVVHGIHGYSGPINVGVVINSDGTTHSVHHVASKETESYLNRIASRGFYSQMKDMKLSGEHQIDAVSGATLTTEAVAHTASELISLASPEPLVTLSEIDEMNPFQVHATLSNIWILHAIVIGLMFFYGIQKRWRKSKRGMLILSILSVIYIGFFLNNSFTYVSFIHPFVGTSVSALVGIYALFVLLGVIWGKNTYCKYVCPFGNAQRLAMRITPKKWTAKFFLSNKWVGRIRNAIALVLIGGVILGMRGWSNYELFPDFFGMEFLSMWFIIAAGTVFLTVRYPMLWCRLLCPTGSVLDTLSEVVELKWKKRKSA